MQEAQQALVSQDNRSSSAESIPYREAGFGSLGQKPLHRLQLTAYLIGDFFFQTIPKWAFRPHKSPHPQQFCSEGEHNYTRESS
ncbi:RNF212B isoform 5 [Pan troglodytes]|uniref:RNF212B isoform 5 n=3 Tax=Pan TaxID=9596 RepID=A0A6D2XIS1_PANTR|nr:RNF212B isoform 5 [Pan troglodytes]